jgi:hypothetical protein
LPDASPFVTRQWREWYYTDPMMIGERFEAGWEGLWLVVECLDAYYEAYVYDPGRCEVLHSASRMRLDAAKLAVVEYVITKRFGPQPDLKPQVIADMLDWKKMA